MRPRVFPAEDFNGSYRRDLLSLGFNEAAGIPRGRPGGLRGSLRRCSSFNEAAGIPRGRRGEPA